MRCAKSSREAKKTWRSESKCQKRAVVLECDFEGCARSWCHIASDVNRAVLPPASACPKPHWIVHMADQPKWQAEMQANTCGVPNEGSWQQRGLRLTVCRVAE
jgi:hypothetical protein